MLSHRQFGKLRLSQFVPEKDLTPLDNWEYMGRLCVGEAIGFSEWLRFKRSDNVLRSLALDFSELSRKVVTAVLERLGLPLRPGMSIEQIKLALGEPKSTEAFVKNRKTFDFVCGKRAKYLISCTLLNKGGLTYLVVMSR